MKCEHCGADIDFEDKFCKSCGMPNSFAVRHIADMEQYEREYEETKEEVNKRTSGALRGAIRIAAILALIILIAIAGNMDEIRYDIHRSQLKKEINANEAKYDKKFKEFIANEEFIEMEHYIDTDDLMIYGTNIYKCYGRFCNSLSEYQAAFRDTGYLYSSIYEDKHNDYSSFDYGQYVEDNKKTAGQHVANFFKYKKEYLEAIEKEYCDIPKEYQQLEIDALNVMSEHITDLAMGIYGITEEDAYSLEEMSSARIEMLFEEAKVNE